MKNPANYKTASGLYRSVVKAVEKLQGVQKAWYIQNAAWTAENVFNDEKLAQQIRFLGIGKALVDELTPYN